jgi:hypothetical protein
MKVGDKVWFVPNNSRGEEYDEGKYIEITRLGRVYAYSKQAWREYKIKIDNGNVYDTRNESGTEGRVYLSQEEHTLERLRKAEWKRVQQWIARQWVAPDDVTLSEIMEIEVILKLRQEEDAPRPSREERAYAPVLDDTFYHD